MKIVVLAGGLSPERHVSLTSGAMVAKALRSIDHQVVLIDMYFDTKPAFDYYSTLPIPEEYNKVNTEVPDLFDLMATKKYRPENPVGDNVVRLCQQADIAFLALHGACGEDGRLQALLDLENVIYTGSDYISSAIAMDKDLTKRLLADKIPTAKWQKVRVTPANINDLIENTPLPIVVKPISNGSSIGVSIAKDRVGLKNALHESIFLGGDTILEEYIKGREIQIAILGNRTLPPIEIIIEDGFYDMENKYTPDLATEICPAQIPQEIADKLSEYAMTAFRTLGLAVLARADFIVAEDGTPYFLEINTLPGMTPTSLVPQEAAAIGMTYPELCQTIIDESLKKRR